MEIFQGLFDSSQFMPHGHCYLWKPGVLWLHIVSDGLIVLSYFSIPLALVYFVRKREDLVFNWVFRLFAAFIFWCGMTHLLNIWVVWNPNYWIDGGVKAITAAVSVATAAVLWPLIPNALRLPSPSQLQQANAALEQEVAERARAEEELSRLNRTLEMRIEERTHELARSNTELRQFAYVVSHDLREPLRAVASYSQLIEKRYGGQFDETGTKYLGYIVDGAKRMHSLIGDLLTYARIEGDEVRNESVSCDEVLRRVLKNLDERIHQNNVKIEIEPLPVVRGRENLLEQVFQNLIVNAIKYGPEDGATEVGVRALSDGESWRFEIEDNGIGIDPADHERIFQLFQRVAVDRSKEGTGLGLAISRKIVEQCGGRLWVESKLGEGAKFCFTLERGEEGGR